MTTGTFMRSSVMCALAILASASFAAEQPVNALAKWIPAEALIAVAYDGSNEAAKGTALHDLLNEPDVKALLEGPAAAFRKLATREAMKKGDLDLDTLIPLLQTKVAFAFLGLAPPAGEGLPPQPELVLVAEVGQGETAAAKAANLVVETIKNKAGLPPDAFKAAKVGGVDGFTTKFGPGSLSYATTKGLFVLGTGEAAAKVLDANVTKLDGLKEFQRVSALTGGNELLLVHYNHAAALQKFGFFIPPPAARFLSNAEFGLANVKSLTLAAAADGRGIRLSCFIYAPGERKGILKALAGKPLDPALVKLAPKSADFFRGASLDLGNLWDFIVAQVVQNPAAEQRYEDAMARLNGEAGFDLRKDFVGSLGDEFAVFGSPISVVVKVKDQVKFKSCIEHLLGKLAEGAGKQRDFKGAELALNTMTYKGRTITYVDGKHMPLVVQPAYTIVGDYAVINLFPVSAKEYIDAMEGGATLLDNEGFKAARAHLGENLSGLYYSNSEAFVRDMYTFVPMVLGGAKMAPPEAQDLMPDPAKIPPFATIAKHVFPSVAGCRPLDDGILWETYGPFGVPTPPSLSQGGGLFTASMLAGMLLPAVSKARGEARKVQGMSSLRQIGIAANVWAETKGNGEKWPPSLKALLDDGVLKDQRVFLSPNSGTKPEEGKFVSDFDSTFERAGFALTEDKTPADLPMAWERRAFSGDGRNVLFFDAHVEFVREDRFKQLMEKVDKFVADNAPKK